MFLNDRIKASEIPVVDPQTGLPVPEFRFGSYELAVFHRNRETLGGVTSCVFGKELYIVDHGHFRTLNQLIGGSRNSKIIDIVEGE